MARDGYRIFDSDTHVGPDARILLEPISAQAEKDTAGRLGAVQVDRTAPAM